MKWILLVLFPLPSLAALPVVLPKAISFYKSPQSLFVSGQCSREDLEKNILRSEAELSFEVAWDRKSYQFKATEILRDAQLLKSALTKELVVLRDKPQSLGRFVVSVPAKTEVEVLNTDPLWALVRFKNQEGWLPLQSLEARYTDGGSAVTLLDTYLRAKPSLNARLSQSLPQGTRLQEFRIEKNWLHVLRPQEGYVDLGHVYLRADFARWAYHNKLGWIQVRHRETTSLRTQDNLLFPLTEFTAFITDPARAFVLNAQNQGPQRRSRVEIKKPVAEQWAISKLKDHGEVWWKRDSIPLMASEAAGSLEKIKTEDLLKRPVFSMAFADSKKIQGLVSAKGIYRTDDGVQWHKLDFFGNNDYPVAVHKDGVWFVGSYRSLDHGQTFEPFIRWDRVADVLTQEHVSVGSMMKILKIESLKSPYIQILMDTGSRRVSLQTHILNQTWRAIK